MKKCEFKGCEIKVEDDQHVCDNCCYKLHVEIRRRQGFTEEQARIEWERQDELPKN